MLLQFDQGDGDFIALQTHQIRTVSLYGETVTIRMNNDDEYETVEKMDSVVSRINEARKSNVTI